MSPSLTVVPCTSQYSSQLQRNSGWVTSSWFQTGSRLQGFWLFVECIYNSWRILLRQANQSHVFFILHPLEDVGGSQYVIDGKIKLKNDTTLESFTETGLKFADGSELSADVIIFCTG